MWDWIKTKFKKKKIANKEPEVNDDNSTVIYLKDHNNFPVILSFDDKGKIFVQADFEGVPKSEIKEIMFEVEFLVNEAIQKEIKNG